MSDTISISSNQSGDVSSPGGIIVEEVGHLTFPEFTPKKLAFLHLTLAALSEDGRLLLGELRTRGGDDWVLAGRSITNLNPHVSENKKYVDLTLVPNVKKGPGNCSIMFLVEKKNKERYITAHNIKHGKILILEEEFSSYDKVNVLGKGLTHIASDPNNPEPIVYSVSNLLRKLKLEDGGTNLKPTTARAQIPSEVQDGTISLAIQSNPRVKNAASSSLIIGSFKTKSATKNKFMIEWFQCKKDEITCLRSPVKLPESCEPSVILVDPKDAKNAFVLCVNRSLSSTSLFKISKGRRHEEAIFTFNFEVDLAVLGLNADQTVTLLVFNSQKDVAKIFSLQKTEGFRGRHPVCSNCPALELLSTSSHVQSCATTKWQLNVSQADQVLNPGLNIQMSLVTLVDLQTGKYVLEPDSSHPYRLSILGCETQGFGAVAILMEDLERVFENADDKLQGSVLKICMNLQPCKDSLSQISAWLITGRLNQVELSYVTNSKAVIDPGSDRFQVKPISPDRFRGYITDLDWTQMNQRQGTFTLDDSSSKSRIPRISSAGPIPAIPNSHQRLNGSQNQNDLEHLQCQLSDCLVNMRRDEERLKQNIQTMQINLEMLNKILIQGQDQVVSRDDEEETLKDDETFEEDSKEM